MLCDDDTDGTSNQLGGSIESSKGVMTGGDGKTEEGDGVAVMIIGPVW